MAAPTTLYVKDSAADDWRILSGITDWAKCVIPVTGVAYRDTGWQPTGGSVSAVAGSSTLVTLSGAPGAYIPDGVHVDTTSNNYIASLVGSLPDEMSHAAQRQWLRMESATVFAFDVAHVIPVSGASAAFTVVTTGTDTITATAHGFSTGDIIRITSGTIGGTSAANFYEVQRVDANSLKLTVFGVVVDLTSGTTGTLTLVSSASLLNGQFLFVLDSNNPAFSVGDPR